MKSPVQPLLPLSHRGVLRLNIRRVLVHVAVSLLPALAIPEAGSAPLQPAEWRFIVRLDGKPIGTHRFLLERTGKGMTMQSDARFDVTFLGVPLYRYRHHATERWSNDCLESIEARTDDNGRRTEVRGQATRTRFDLETRRDGREPVASAVESGCLMSFAYWHPALATQAQLLDPGSGRVEPVAMGAPPALPASLEADAGPLRGLRIAGLPQPIDVGYAGERWIGLDTVLGGRHLSYRLH